MRAKRTRKTPIRTVDEIFTAQLLRCRDQFDDLTVTPVQLFSDPEAKHLIGYGLTTTGNGDGAVSINHVLVLFESLESAQNIADQLNR